jgi:hypothetical protein
VQANKQFVRRSHILHDAHCTPFLVREFGTLVEHVNAVDLRAGDEEELFVRIGR